MAEAIVAYVDDLCGAIRGLAAALIGRTSHEPDPDPDEGDDQ